jgi:HAD superfamily hydrolase (TIGR01509 family)
MGKDMPIHGVVFDLDGTLVRQELDFEAIRREMAVPSGTPLLEVLEGLTEPRRSAAWAILDRHESVAAGRAELHDGVGECLAWLAEHGIRRAILSRNSRRSIDTVLQRLALTFDPIVAREDAPFKPSPHGLWHICRAWGLPPGEVLMVGDYLYDLQAGKAAGTWTALVTHGRDLPFAHLADVILPSLLNLPDYLDNRGR